VENHRLDAAFVGGFHQNAALHQEGVFREELALLSSVQFRSLNQLVEQISKQTVLVFRTGCFYRSTLEQWFYQSRLIPGQTLELGTLDGIMSCVAAGMGITLLPKAVVERHGNRRSVRCHELPPALSNVTTVFIRNHDAVVTPALSALLALTHEQFGNGSDQSNADAEISLADTANL
jgi:DNA-binding transcriptional LysR family regulator